jgi:ATP-binding cassette subfamily B multidrug efflux pump
VVVGLVLISVVLNVIAPRILGQAMDVIFAGVVGKQLPAGASKEQFVDGLRQQGQDNFADMVSRMELVPGTGINFDKLTTLIAVVLLMYFVANIFLWLQGYVLNRIVMKVIRRLRDDTEKKLNRLPLNYFDTRQRGDVLSRVTNDVDNIQQALQQAFAQLINSVLTVIGIVVMMFIVSWQLALIALVALPLSGVAAGMIGARSQKLFAAQWKNTGSLNGQIEESFSGHDLVRVFGRDADMLEALRGTQRGPVQGQLRRAVRVRHHLPGDAVRVLPQLRRHRRGGRPAGRFGQHEPGRRHGLHPVLARVHPAAGPDGGHGQHAPVRRRVRRARVRVPGRR